ncbi:DUF2066 domain-containing protein [Pseudomonas flexibilis]|uniref:DUF2066 domain-containing protein n=1 Tax=Pseudomonas flexibilis TaxID=706570 RepID=A0A0B3BY59_9PSED|nr:DUF2066 domain-containing protein [Pseudomonas flexibilis]KHO65609.1 hypothetical protein PT85_06030 [Pseudomonas flexibilis]SCX79524.1 hypothetical protein SAMN02927929_00398 [Pseudomonas flexibilis]
MRVIAPLLALCSLSLLSLNALAAPVPGLYQVRETVGSQHAAERLLVLQQALDTLVLRLTGDPEASLRPELLALREAPQRLVSRYVYDGNTLVVDFDPATTGAALREAGLSLWGADRPELLVWWMTETPDGAQLVGDAQDSASLLQKAAQHRGLPLRLPLADLTEQMMITPDVLMAHDAQELRKASQRYGVDALLAVQAKPARGNWQGRWQVWLGKDLLQGEATGNSLAALGDAVMLAVQQKLAPRFVVRPETGAAVTLVVDHADLLRYAELERLLEPFHPRLRKVEGARLTYRLQASPDQLRAQLALLRLREVPPPVRLASDPAQPGAALAQAYSDNALYFQ